MYMRIASVLVPRYRRSSLFLTRSALPVVLSTICVRPPRPQEAPSPSSEHSFPYSSPQSSELPCSKLTLPALTTVRLSLVDDLFPRAYRTQHCIPRPLLGSDSALPHVSAGNLELPRMMRSRFTDLYYALPGRQLLYNVNMPTTLVLFTGGRRDGDDVIVVVKRSSRSRASP